MKKHARKKKQKIKTYYLQDRHAQYCTWWDSKVILGTQFFNMPNRHISSDYKPEFLGAWS